MFEMSKDKRRKHISRGGVWSVVAGRVPGQ